MFRRLSGSGSPALSCDGSLGGIDETRCRGVDSVIVGCGPRCGCEVKGLFGVPGLNAMVCKRETQCRLMVVVAPATKSRTPCSAVLSALSLCETGMIPSSSVMREFLYLPTLTMGAIVLVLCAAVFQQQGTKRCSARCISRFLRSAMFLT